MISTLRLHFFICFIFFFALVAAPVWGQPGYDYFDNPSSSLQAQILQNPNDTSLLLRYALLTHSTPELLKFIHLDEKENGLISFELANNEWNRRDFKSAKTYLDTAFAHGYKEKDYYTLKAQILREMQASEERAFLDEAILLLPREPLFKFNKAYLLLAQDSLTQADIIFRDALMYTPESVVFPITYWIEAIYKKDEKLAREWMDQMNVSVRSMSDVSNAHFYSGYYCYKFFKDYANAATYFDLCLDDAGLDATKLDYSKINGGNNQNLYYRGISYYQLDKKEEAYDAIFYAFLWSIEPQHFEYNEEFNLLIKQNPRDQRLQYLQVVREMNCWYTTKKVDETMIKKGISSIKKEIALHPENTPQHDYAQYYLAFAYHVLGKHDLAKQTFAIAENGQYRPHFSVTLRSKIFDF